VFEAIDNYEGGKEQNLGFQNKRLHVMKRFIYTQLEEAKGKSFCLCKELHIVSSSENKS
jgi:hypothetical protein